MPINKLGTNIPAVLTAPPKATIPGPGQMPAKPQPAPKIREPKHKVSKLILSFRFVSNLA